MDNVAKEDSASLFGAMRKKKNEDDEEHPVATEETGAKTQQQTADKSNQQNDNEAETMKKMTGIESAKDRAQITSSTAMSIVHVALLKNVLDAGTENDRYYNYRVGFILAALILQIIAGFLALYVALLRNYFTKYRDDFLNDCFKICCPLDCRMKHKRQTIEAPKWKKKHKMYSSINIMDEESVGDPGCCPFECTTKGYYHYEHGLLEAFEDLSEQVIKSDIDAASSVIELKWFDQRLDSLKQQVERYETASDAESRHKVARINEQLEELLNRKEEIEGQRRLADNLLAKGVVMERHVQKIYQQHVLKRATFWQNLLNMVFYVVFVLNAIIAGFGLAEPSTNMEGTGTITTAAPPILE